MSDVLSSAVIVTVLVTIIAAMHEIVNTDVLWLGVAFLYIATAIYFEAFFPREIPRLANLSMLMIGGAVFVVVNRHWWLTSAESLFVSELLVLALLVLAWYSTYRVLRAAAGHCHAHPHSHHQ